MNWRPLLELRNALKKRVESIRKEEPLEFGALESGEAFSETGILGIAPTVCPVL
jgi:hypothetical protein